MDGQILEVPGKIQKLAEHIYDYDWQKDIQRVEKQTVGFELQPAVVTYLEKENSRSCFFRAPMAAFHAWYRDFPFAALLNEPVKRNGKGKFELEYRMIFLNPSYHHERTKGEDVFSNGPRIAFLSLTCMMRTYYCIATSLEFHTVLHTMQRLPYSAARTRQDPNQVFPGMVTNMPKLSPPSHIAKPAIESAARR